MLRHVLQAMDPGVVLDDWVEVGDVGWSFRSFYSVFGFLVSDIAEEKRQKLCHHWHNEQEKIYNQLCPKNVLHTAAWFTFLGAIFRGRVQDASSPRSQH